MQNLPCFRATRRFLPGLLALGLLAAVPAARAQTAPKIFVASTGLDTNAGTRTAPVRTFNQAQSLVAAGGEIVVLDTAGYGPLFITKSLAVTVPPGVNAFITVGTDADGNVIDGIDVFAGANDMVRLSGLIIEGSGIGPGATGIQALTVGTLTVENCTVRNFTYGITANSDSPANLVVRGGSVLGTGYAINAQATDSATVTVTVKDCAVDNAVYAAFTSISSNAPVVADHCLVTNSGYVFNIAGTGGTVYANNNTLTGNRLGVNGTGTYSYGNNVFVNNANNGSFTGTLTPR